MRWLDTQASGGERPSPSEPRLRLAERALGESVATAVAAQNLAVTYKYRGAFDAAEVLLMRALAIGETVDDRRLVAVVCHNLGGLAHARGDPAGGVAWARGAVQIREDLGDDPLALAADRGALAGLLIDLRELDEAERLLTAARTTFVDRLGEGDLEVAIIDGSLAAVALGRGALDDAERHARAALAKKEMRLGLAHPDLVTTLTTLGTIRRQQGACHEAETLNRRALALLGPLVGIGHPLHRTITRNLERAWRELAVRGHPVGSQL